MHTERQSLQTLTECNIMFAFMQIEMQKQNFFF